MNKIRVYAALLVIFISGVVVGTVGTSLYVRHQIRSKINALIRGNDQVAVQLVMANLSRALDLSSEQRRHIHPFVDTAVKRVRILRAHLRPQFEKVFLQASGKMKPYLNEDQQKKLDRLMQRLQRGLSTSRQ